jgi:hypothetical protein
VWGITFEVTPTAEAGAVRPGCDDGTSGAGRPYSACRSGSALSEGLGVTGRSNICGAEKYFGIGLGYVLEVRPSGTIREEQEILTCPVARDATNLDRHNGHIHHFQLFIVFHHLGRAPVKVESRVA